MLRNEHHSSQLEFKPLNCSPKELIFMSSGHQNTSIPTGFAPSGTYAWVEERLFYMASLKVLGKGPLAAYFPTSVKKMATSDLMPWRE
jgi:hypothetical protein